MLNQIFFTQNLKKNYGMNSQIRKKMEERKRFNNKMQKNFIRKCWSNTFFLLEYVKKLLKYFVRFAKVKIEDVGLKRSFDGR